MTKEDLMVIVGVLKYLLGFVGISLTIILLSWGVVAKNNKRVRRAGIIFLSTCGLLILITLIEFLVTG